MSLKAMLIRMLVTAAVADWWDDKIAPDLAAVGIDSASGERIRDMIVEKIVSALD